MVPNFINFSKGYLNVYKDSGIKYLMAILQRQLSRKVGGREYVKWVLVIPERIINEVDFKEGEELEFDIKNKKVILRKKFF